MTARAIEIKRVLETIALVECSEGEMKARVLLDTGASINIVSQLKAVEWGLMPIEADLPAPSWFDNSKAPCYGAYEVAVIMTDSQGHARGVSHLFYATDSHHYDFIFGMPGMTAEGIHIDVAKRAWRWGAAAKAQADPILKEQAFWEHDSPIEEAIAQVVLMSIAVKAQAETPSLPEALRQYEDVFSLEAAGILPPHKATDHAIETQGKEPPHLPIYNLSSPELEVLREYLDAALAKGWIRRSISPAGAPIIFVPKKGGSLRLCVDYRGLNQITVKNRHPLPLISETLDRLAGSIWFTKLDLTDAYHRIRIKEGDEWKTAFRTRYGHFEYLVMPFGLANAPATFQAYINRALSGLVDYLCVVYLDDILIYSSGSKEDHWKRVGQVLERLRKYSLYVKLSKCEFAVHQVEFLGYIISNEGVAMDPRRVSAIAEWPRPKTHREVQVFLGFCNFYRRFIRAYSRIASPLTGLLIGSENGKKTGPLDWTVEAETAFNQLREVFTQAPLLRHYEPELPIRIETDASD